MNDAERRMIEWECAHNTIRFYNRLDAVKGAEAAAVFAEDGVWYREGDAGGFVGREEIAGHVNKLPDRGNPNVPREDRMVYHLVTNVEVTVIDDDTAEVTALTSVIPGARGKDGEPGTTKGIVAVFPTTEVHKRTPEGWRIASKRTLRALRVV
ncbi:MAG TPA: nuclear transport factor 2 family protein [Hyphomicrobiales bacterium]|nr:nuclear transport factor 2 family protein [Hyphomicrobiales bacterium]